MRTKKACLRVTQWDDSDPAQTRAYASGGVVVGLGTQIVPNGAAIVKQVASGSIPDTATAPAVAFLIGALR
jgi:hypothetical protein